jgi:hypothetical protein
VGGVLPSPDCEGLPFAQRARDSLIHAWAGSREWGAKLLRPGAGIIGLALAVFGVANLARAQDPQAEMWSAGSWGSWLLIASGAVGTLGHFLVTLGYGRRLRTEESEAALYKTCRSIARLVSQVTKIPDDKVGVHVWAVAGPPGLKHLVRRTKFLSVDRPESAVTWRRGRGALGVSWDERREKVWDLETLQAKAPTNQAFCDELSTYERMGLTWSEFENTKHYSAAWVRPILRGGPGSNKVIGCLSVDIVEEHGAGEKLERLVQEQSQDLRALWSLAQHRLR